MYASRTPWRNVRDWRTPYFSTCKNHEWKTGNKENIEWMQIKVTLNLHLKRALQVDDCSFSHLHIWYYFAEKELWVFFKIYCVLEISFEKQSVKWKTLFTDPFRCLSYYAICEHTLVVYLLKFLHVHPMVKRNTLSEILA